MSDRDTAHTDDVESRDDAVVGRLLRAAGRRERPPEAFARALRESLRDEWLAAVAARQARRRRFAVGGAVAAAVAVVAVATTVWLSVPQGAPIATVVLASGAGARIDGDPATAGLGIRDGALIETADGRLALGFPDGVSVRVDADTGLVVESAERVTLSHGALYVDAGAGRPGRSALVIDTPHGSVRHVGTQYQVRLDAGSLSVSVREGLIALERPDARLQGRAGEQLRVSVSGNVERVSVAADAPDWSWVATVTPPFAIDDRPLTEFLAWAGRESGREVDFATPAAEAEARQVVLKGSIDGLTPEQAVDAVLLSTSLRAERSPGRLTVRQ